MRDVGQQVEQLWTTLGGVASALDRLTLNARTGYLPSVYDVEGLAIATVSAATLAVAELDAARSGKAEIDAVEVDSLEACAAFRSEALLRPVGWELPNPWDSVAGDYLAKDRWIRLHTNYPYHREATLRVLGVPADRVLVAEAVAQWQASELERRVVQEGGCAATMYSEGEWELLPDGATTLAEPACAFRQLGERAEDLRDERMLAGVRVLDLTRVIAGPECTRVLAAHGADVLRLDPPGFEEVPALLPDMTVGKRCAFVDFATPLGKADFERLLKEAHVLVVGYRSGALDRFGFTLDHIHRLNPSLIVARLNAYGWVGALEHRRGFDSLVQMSCGIAAEGSRVKGVEMPFPLPAQALDHGAGFVLAAAICRALTHQILNGETLHPSTSLIGISNFLKSLPRQDRIADASPIQPELIEADSEWGRLKRAGCPGSIGGIRGRWLVSAGRLGRHEPRFATL